MTESELKRVENRCDLLELDHNKSKLIIKSLLDRIAQLEYNNRKKRSPLSMICISLLIASMFTTFITVLITMIAM